MLIRAVFTGGILLGIAACGAGNEVAKSSIETEFLDNDNSALVREGKEIFMGYCVVCHQVSERVADEGAPTGLRRASTGETMTSTELAELIRNPPLMMPTMPLQDHQLASLVAYLQALPEQVIAVSGMP